LSITPIKRPPFVESKIDTEPIPADVLEAAKQQLLAEGYFAPANQQVGDPNAETATSAPSQNIINAIIPKIMEQLRNAGWLSPQDAILTRAGRDEKRKGRNGRPLNDEYELPSAQDMLARLHREPFVTVSVPTPEHIKQEPSYQDGTHDHYELIVHTGTYWYIPTGIPIEIPRPVYEIGVSAGIISPLTIEDIALTPRTVRKGNSKEKAGVKLEPRRVFGSYSNERPGMRKTQAPEDAPPAWVDPRAIGLPVDVAVGQTADIASEVPRGARTAPEAVK
jgi:hypothetical protein